MKTWKISISVALPARLPLLFLAYSQKTVPCQATAVLP
jgi:hypothetical protein